MKVKRNRKLVSILLTLSFLVCMLVPMAGPAGAATTYSALTTPTVKAPVTIALGTILIDIDTLATGTHKAVFTLPTDFEHSYADGDLILDFSSKEGKIDSVTVYTDPYDANEFRLEVVATGLDADVKITVPLANVYVPNTASGDITCTITGVGGQLSSGSVVVGKTSGGQLSILTQDVPSITDAGTIDGKIKINVFENVAGALKVSTAASVKFTLPVGFSWNDDITVIDVATGAAPPVEVDVFVDDDDRKLIVTKSDTTTRLRLRISVDISVDDDARFGDVVATVGGASSSNVSKITVANYADFGVKVEGSSIEEDVLAGRDAEEIGDFYITEAAPGSLIEGRTITLKLPSSAKWVVGPSFENDKGDVDIVFVSTSSDERTVKYNVYNGSATASKILFKDAEVMLAIDTTGDLAVEVGGSAGASGSVVVAKILAPVTAIASGTPDIIIGKQAQDAGDITIVEAKKEAIDKVGDGDLVIYCPAGVEFATVPTVAVTDGDLRIDKATKSGGTLTIDLKGTSSEASTIKISDIKLTVDRTVPAGDLKLKIKGAGINMTADYFANATVAASVVNAVVVTPAPQDQEAVVVFTIGDANYTVNGVAMTMDTAPYIKNDRTYLPIRFVAQAVGVSDDNIMWNAADKSVVLIKGDRIVKLVIGSTTMMINGVSFTMDVAPEIVDPGRTMLPIRWVAQALGCSVEWDAATQTVTVN